MSETIERVEQDLRTAVERRYVAFAPYQLKLRMDACQHCVSDEDKRRLYAKPLRAPSGDDLGSLIEMVGEEMRAGNNSHAPELRGIFAPICDWDDAGGSISLGNRVFALLDAYYRSA